MTVESAGLLTPQDVCRILNIKMSNLRALIHKKKIPFIKVERLLRFRAEDIQNYLIKNTNTSGSILK